MAHKGPDPTSAVRHPLRLPRRGGRQSAKQHGHAKKCLGKTKAQTLRRNGLTGLLLSLPMATRSIADTQKHCEYAVFKSREYRRLATQRCGLCSSLPRLNSIVVRE